MKYIESIREGERVSGIYLCKQRQSAVTKNGKAYENMILQDKTGLADAKIWDPNSQGIEDFGALDYVEIVSTADLQPLERLEKPFLMAMAVYFGKTRLIDNWICE